MGELREAQVSCVHSIERPGVVRRSNSSIMSYPSTTYRPGPVSNQVSPPWTPRQSGHSILPPRSLLSPRSPAPAHAPQDPQVNSQIILAASVGNPQASTHLLRSYYECVFDFLWRMTAAEMGEHLLEELCQETFSRFFIALRNEADPLARPLRPWLIDIANAVATERIRLLRQKSKLQAHANQNQIPSDVEPWELFSAAMESLSPAHREILFLRQDQGLSYIEIARILGVCVGTVKSRLSRSRKALDRIMKQLAR